MDTGTNEATADYATRRGALPLRRLALIGVAGSDTDRRALLRTAGGQIRQVTLGDTVGNGTVVAISEAAITLARANGRTEVMHLPRPEHIRSAA